MKAQSILWAILLAPFFSFSQVNPLVSPDTGPYEQSRSRTDLTLYQNEVYFFTSERLNYGLWKTDGTAAGTQRLNDFNQVFEIAAADSGIVFSGNEIGAGIELFTSDGTPGGTQLLLDLIPGFESSIPLSLTPAGGWVYFKGTTRQTGRELWKTNGTLSGTQLIVDLSPGTASSNLGKIIPFQEQIAFIYPQNGTTGLWISDGTAVGTQPVPFPAGISSISVPEIMKVIGDSLYFIVEANNQYELWRTDGDTTVVLTPLGGRSYPLHSEQTLFRFQNDLYYFTHPGPHTFGGPDTLRLMKTDAAFTASTEIAQWPFPNMRTIFVHPTSQQFTFLLERFIDDEVELWRSEGTAATTTMLQNWSSSQADNQRHFQMDSLSIFTLDNSEVWRSNGQANGTYVLDTFGIFSNFYHTYESPISISPLGNEFLVFGKQAGSTIESELYLLDGSSGFSLVTNIEKTPLSASISPVLSLPEKMLFQATAETTSLELWVSEGLQGNTQMLPEIGEGYTLNPAGDTIWLGGNPTYFTADNGIAYFTGSYLPTGSLEPISTLFQSDGTAAGTYRLDTLAMLRNVFIRNNSAYFNKVVFKGKIYFAASPPQTPFGDVELYAFDLQTQSSAMVKNINLPASGNPLYYNSYPQHLTVVEDQLFFSAYTDDEGTELWVTDGTTAGTQMVKEMVNGSLGGFDQRSRDAVAEPEKTIALDSLLLFTSATDSLGWELWRSNGTEQGTYVLKDIWPGAESGRPLAFHAAAGKVFFLAEDSIHGQELWVTDGTAVGTQRVDDFHPQTRLSSIEFMLDTDTKLYFRRYTANEGVELWTTDGTAAGTQLLIDLVPGPVSGAPYSLAETDSFVYFLQYDQAASQYNLWQTDGTTANTQVVPNFQFPPELYSLSDLTVGGDYLYLVGYHDDFGQTLFSISPGLGAMKIESFERRFLVYPNPVQDQLWIDVPPETREIRQIELLNLQGQTVHTYGSFRTRGETSLPLKMPEGLVSGYYFLSIHTSNGPRLIKLQVQ